MVVVYFHNFHHNKGGHTIMLDVSPITTFLIKQVEKQYAVGEKGKVV